MVMFAPSSRAPHASIAALAAGLVVLLGVLAFSFGWVSSASAAPADDSAEPLGPSSDPSPQAGDPFGSLAAQATTRAVTATGAIAAAATPPPPPPFACPVPGSEFIDSWGFPRSGGRRHKGVDMMAPHGSPVLAPVAGVVRHSNSRLGGLGFWLTDADGNEYFGSHLATLGPTGFVEAGQQIGTVGSTGNASASGPHLHFEVMPAGVGSTNPYPFTRFWCGEEAATPDI